MKREKEVSTEIFAGIEKKEIIAPPVVVEKPTVEKTQVAEESVRPAPVDKPVDEKISEPANVNIAPPGTAKPQYPAHEVRESWFEKWLRNNPDIEKFIGENLINKIGIAVLILGIAFFVKYAIDKEWINEVGRISIGLFCGIVLIFLSYRLRKNYRSFSSVLVGGGLTVFYFTIAFAFHQYNLLSQSAAFIIMVIITAFAVALSILYDRIELAILATIGGFITPFLVSRGEGNYMVLFTYLTILNAGLIVLAFYKRWQALPFIAFVFTAIIYGGWIFNNSLKADFPYAGTFLFGSLFYAMFLAMNIMSYLQKSTKFAAADVALLIAVNLGYYASGLFLLQHWNFTIYKGLFTAGLGVINLALAIFFYRRKNIDKNFIYLLIGITLTFISLTAPVQLEGHYITLFWAAEMVLVFWLYQKSFIKFLKIASALITVLALLSLLMDWRQIYVFNNDVFPVIINKGFITTLFCGGAAGIMSVMMKREADSFYSNGITNNAVKQFYIVCSALLFFFAGLFEIRFQFAHRYAGTGLQYIYAEMYVTGYFVLLLIVLRLLNIKMNNYVRIALTLLVCIYYIANIHSNYLIEKFLLEHNTLRAHYITHCAGIIFMASLISQTVLFVKSNHAFFEKMLTAFTWIAALIIIIFLSAEIKELYVWLTYHDKASVLYAENLYSKAGLSIVWGLSSFICIWLGMRYSFKTLRIIGLVLFGITLLKLFAFDIKNIPPGGKILAFILLGVVLLTVSFMYQRLKKLIIDDGAKME
ncbi:MAG TPA: DUF2339 domain-containing protein [Parafilimonas sp.]|nr:DUF2339 domain-containing protein [Parafilimonas sp.]